MLHLKAMDSAAASAVKQEDVFTSAPPIRITSAKKLFEHLNPLATWNSKNAALVEEYKQKFEVYGKDFKKKFEEWGKHFPEEYKAYKIANKKPRTKVVIAAVEAAPAPSSDDDETAPPPPPPEVFPLDAIKRHLQGIVSEMERLEKRLKYV